MYPQTETMKSFHAKPQWQQILAVSTFLGKVIKRSLNQQTTLVDVQSQQSTLQFSTAKGIRRVLALKVLWSVLLRF